MHAMLVLHIYYLLIPAVSFRFYEIILTKWFCNIFI